MTSGFREEEEEEEEEEGKMRKKKKRSVLFYNITQLMVVNSCGRFGKTYLSHHQG